MKCVICKNGETHAGFSTITIERNESVIVFKQVPSQICDNCGEYYLDEKISNNITNQANEAIKNGTEFEVVRLRVA